MIPRDRIHSSHTQDRVLKLSHELQLHQPIERHCHELVLSESEKVKITEKSQLCKFKLLFL